MASAVPREPRGASGAWTPSDRPFALTRRKLASGVRHASDSKSAMLPQPGDVVAGKYTIVRELGAGGMAVVYEALHTKLQQPLAIKVLRPHIADARGVLARFEREARITAQLRSAHAARVVDVDVLPSGLPYMVMEYLEGHDLDAELQRSGPLPPTRAVDVVLQVAGAMQEAHALGIVHRDLKPSNLFLYEVGDRLAVKVLDFGISKVATGDGARLTVDDAYLGTPAYAAPEQLREPGVGDARSDIWALGIVLYELLTGHPPFEGGSTSVIAKVMTATIREPAGVRPELPRDLSRVVMRALRRDPRERFQSMQAFAEALSPFGPSRPTAALVADVQRTRGKLGEILVSEGLLSSRDLELALAEQRQSGKLLGSVLIDNGLVSHADMLTALAKQQGVHAPKPCLGRPSGDGSPRKRSESTWWIWAAVAVGLAGGAVLGATFGGTMRGARVSPPAAAAPR